MRKTSKKKKQEIQRTANECIKNLFSEAKLMYKEDKELSNRYVSLVRKISMKYKIKIDKKNKRRFCKTCYSYLVPGSNCRVRLTGRKVVYFCSNCRNYMRFPYIKEQKKSKKI